MKMGLFDKHQVAMATFMRLLGNYGVRPDDDPQTLPGIMATAPPGPA